LLGVGVVLLHGVGVVRCTSTVSVKNLKTVRAEADVFKRKRHSVPLLGKW
jgi:hypothetical protein